MSLIARRSFLIGTALAPFAPALVAAEVRKWGPIIQAANIKIN